MDHESMHQVQAYGVVSAAKARSKKMVRVVGHKIQVTAMETVEMKVKCSIIKLVTGKMSHQGP